MLNSENRLRKRKEFAYLYNNGSAKHTNHLTVVYLPTKNRKLKIGFSITKKIGKAHTRNLIKRRLRAIVREFVPQLPNNYNMVIIAKKDIETISYSDLTEQVKQLFNRTGLLGNV